MFRSLDPGDPASFRAGRELDVLVPTRNRATELAATLAGLAAQDVDGPAGGFGIAVSDQSDGEPAWRHAAVAGMVRVLRHRGHPVLLSAHLPLRGVAENRGHLLTASAARYVLFLDDDVWLEPGAVRRLLDAIRRLGCGLVGNAPHGLSYMDDHRPDQERTYREWSAPPHPERIDPRGPEWSRASVHTAANLLHVEQRLALRPDEWRAYRIAWVGACALYDRAKLVDVGGYDFWPRVPVEHSGEDVLVQLRVMDRYGGAGIVPSGAFHLETPTTVDARDIECFDVVAPYD
ncbi:MAG TPA: glycosyltransferase [Rugosimonospora sp.]|jgi:glycosyltransferase involved in cell wall biosynthesis